MRRGDLAGSRLARRPPDTTGKKSGRFDWRAMSARMHAMSTLEARSGALDRCTSSMLADCQPWRSHADGGDRVEKRQEQALRASTRAAKVLSQPLNSGRCNMAAL